MKISNVILIYAAVLMILSQTEWAKSVVFLAIPLLIILIFKHTRISSYGFKKILFLNLIVLLGFISGIMHLTEYDMYFFARDIMYFIQASMFIIIGMYLYQEIRDFKKILKTIVLASFIITLYKLSELIMDPSLIFRLGLETRYEYSLSNATSLLVFVIIFYARKLKYKLFTNRIELLIMIISLFSIGISFSRTFYVILLITLIIPYLSKNRIIFKVYGASVLLVLFVIFGNLFFDIKTGGTQGTTFQSKIIHSLDEMTVSNYHTMADINNNWRGYEAYLGLSKYYKGNFAELLFGQGYGTVVFTPSWIFGEEKLAVLPMFHNGYITIILKTGLVGLLLFFLFLFGLLRTAIISSKRIGESQLVLVGMLLQASVFIIFFRTFVVHGIFATTVPVLILILIGVCLQLIAYENLLKGQQN